MAEVPSHMGMHVRLGFLELINNMLTTGIVPALYQDEEKEDIIGSVGDVAFNVFLFPSVFYGFFWSQAARCYSMVLLAFLSRFFLSQAARCYSMVLLAFLSLFLGHKRPVATVWFY